MKPTKYVIIGNSAAAIGAVEGIRQTDREGSITIISNERHFTYSRPLISYLLLGKTTLKKMRYRNDTFYSDHGCALLLSTTVTEIDTVNKNVILDNKEIIPYDKLLAATGSSPFIPRMEGLETVTNSFTFMNLDDALRLQKTLQKDAKILIIGAGLIGLKCAEGILDSVSSITIVDLAPTVLSSILDKDGAEIVQNHLEKKGISFQLSQSVKRFEGNTAILENGSILPFDILVLAVGVRPNTELLQNIAAIERGILINTKAETSCPDIYAAGDCTQSQDISSGQNKIMALLPNAYMQGECAGINMAGGDISFDKAIPMNAIGFFGLHILTAGNYNGDSYNEHNGDHYKKLFYADNRLNGFILIGNVEKAGIYTSLIRERTPLTSIDFSLVCEKPGLMAFTKEDRKTLLGGGIA